MDPLKRLNEWKGKIAEAQKKRDTYQGRLEGLQEQGAKLRDKIKEDYGADDLESLEQAVEKQRAKVEKMEAKLEGVFDDAG